MVRMGKNYVGFDSWFDFGHERYRGRGRFEVSMK